MTGSVSSPPSTGRPQRRRQFPFGLVMLVFGLGLGFYGGVGATKRAMASPPWLQRIFGLPVVTAPIPSPAPPTTSAQLAQAPPTAPAPGEIKVGPKQSGTVATGTNPDSPDPTVKPEKSPKRRAPDAKDLDGTWSATDNVTADGSAASSLTTAYVFRGDGTGEFDSNGKKLYDLRWTATADEISIDFDGEGPDSGQPWSVKMKWSINDDRTMLTLVPLTGKDPRSYVYSLGPGVYHRKQ